MSADRYEITDADHGQMRITDSHGEHVYLNPIASRTSAASVGAIRQQARDIAELEVFAEIGRKWNADSSLAKWFPLTAEQVEQDAREIAKLRTDLAAAVALAPKMTNARHHGCAFDGWQCFHCGEIFTTVGGAQDHFGAKPDAMPGCLLKVQLGDERGLLMELRKAEARIAAIEAAPVVATVVSHADEGGMWPALDYEDEDLPPIGTHLIARPAKD